MFLSGGYQSHKQGSVTAERIARKGVESLPCVMCFNISIVAFKFAIKLAPLLSGLESLCNGQNF